MPPRFRHGSRCTCGRIANPTRSHRCEICQQIKCEYCIRQDSPQGPWRCNAVPCVFPIAATVAAQPPSEVPPLPAPIAPPAPAQPQPGVALHGVELPPPIPVAGIVWTAGGDLPEGEDPVDLSIENANGIIDCRPIPNFDFDAVQVPENLRQRNLSRLIDIPVTIPHGFIGSIRIQINYDDPNVPAVENDLQNKRVITIGDLHGNTLTLLIILIKCGILVCAQADYEILRRTIQNVSNIVADPFSPSGFRDTNPLTELEYVAFAQALLRSTKVVANRPSIRLLGDILGDRISNDALTLALIGYLQETPNQVSLTIIFSNHDENFIRFLTSPPLNLPLFLGHPNTSLIRFREFLMTLGAESHTKVVISHHIRLYVNCFKLFDCEFADTFGPEHYRPQLVLFSHASFHPRIGFETMMRFVRHSHYIPQRSLGDLTVGKLQQLIDLSNDSFRRVVWEIALNWTRSFVGTRPFDANNIGRMIYLDFFQQRTYPYLAIWLRLRNTHNLDVPCSWQFPLPNIPPNDTELHCIHGHDPLTRASDISLDNNVGKSSTHGGGNLLVHYSSETYVPPS